MPRDVAFTGRSSIASLLVAAAVLSACNDAGALNAMSAGQLFAATSLSAQERHEHIQSLNGRLSSLVGMTYVKGREKPSAALIEDMSECVVDNLQDRSTRLQFIMAMDTIRVAGFRSRPDLSKYRSLATSKGMSGAEFEQQAVEMLRHLASMAENCMRRLGGRG